MVDETTKRPSRRRFLAESALAVGASAGADAVPGVGGALAASSLQGISRSLSSQLPQPILFAPNDLLISVHHTTPTPWPSIGRLTVVLNRTLQPFGLRLIPPAPPRQTRAGRALSAAGRGQQGGWTFRPMTDAQYLSVLRYGVAALKTQRQPVLLGTAVIIARLKQLNATLAGLVQITSATPNWAMSGEPSGYVVGGPGGRPAPETTPPGTSRWHFTFPARVNKVAPRGGARVLVVVLDTSPDAKEVGAAAATFALRNSLLVEMAPGGAHPVEAWEDVGGGMGYPAAHGPFEEYPMRDHGLFVAGIIRDIAPACSLRVVRVLNDWGGGYLTGLIAGLEYVHDLAATRDGPIVVNLSLTVKVPPSAELRHLYAGVLANEKGIAPPYRTPEDASLPLLDVMRGLSFSKRVPILFVAASGNDSEALGSAPLDPRVPAVYSTTLGVAALDAAGYRASYSNRGDEGDLVRNGIATFGGAASTAGGGKGGKSNVDAVRGLFSASIFPSIGAAHLANTTGWARWVGTSFATPVISGLSANLLAVQPSLTPLEVMATLQGVAVPAADSTLHCRHLPAIQKAV